MIYRTCFGCVSHGKPCQSRDDIKNAVAGLGITSLKWKCAARKSSFERGDQVYVTTFNGEKNSWESEISYMSEFPGVVMHTNGTKVNVYIAPGAMCSDEEYAFEPTNGSLGYLSVPMSRLTMRCDEKAEICPTCNGVIGMNAHIDGYYCSRAKAEPEPEEYPF